MKVLVIGGMHGNEPLGIGLVERLIQEPIYNVSAIIANPNAVRINKRFTDTDLNRAFPGDEASYEGKQAKRLLRLCKGFDIVLDFHNTYCPNNDCVFIGKDARPILSDVAGFIRLNRVIIADYGCINKYAPNCISIEVSLNSSRNNVNDWYWAVKKIAATQYLTKAKSIVKYKFVYRITNNDNLRYSLDSKQLCAFEVIEEELASAMGVDSPAYPIFINDRYTLNSYGGLLNKL